MLKKDAIIKLLLSLIFFILLFFNYRNTQNMFNMEKENENRTYNYCIDNKINNDQCNLIISNHQNEHGPDAITFYQIMMTTNKVNWLNYLLVLIISLASSYYICNLFKSKMITNILNREKYSKTMLKTLLKSYQSTLVIIIPIIIILTLTFINTYNLNYNYATNYFPLLWHTNYSPYLYTFTYIIEIILFCLFFININLLIARKNHNLIIVLIESFLIFIGIDILFEVIFGNIISKLIYDGFSSRFNIVNILSAGYATNLIEMLILPIILYIISFIILYFVYKNKEKFIIDIEKN